ncbi:uncharacterized protein LOC121400005 isoform X1 [Xenopus laevis]|uniref:Uncharacterized protein LOC121400005 isoform X1 n=1 Tax=Xenopus laevis TaxID=8355 RepID=A0A8J1MAU9_XENLA|nr:uncharacterized protein LOC121400005 isoform X1 [Xenopus laevis]
MAALKELLARIRAQASEQGDDWVRQQLAAQPAPTARQAASRRRTRPPERLSPAVSSRSSQRRRMRSPSPPVAGPGSSVGASAADRRGTGKKQQGGRMPCRGQGAGRRSRAGMRLGAGSQDGADRSPVVRGGATAGSSPGRSRRESAARRGSSSSRGETTQAGQRQTDRRSTDRESERRQREPAAQRGGHGGRAATSGTDLAGEPGGSSRVSMAAPPAGGDRDGGGFSRCLSPQGAAQRSGGPQQGREGSTSRHREEDRGAASSVTGCAGGRGGPPPANMGAPSVGGCWAGGVSSLLLPLQGSSGQDWSSGLGTAGEAPGTSDGSSGHRATATTDSIMEALRTAPASGPSAGTVQAVGSEGSRGPHPFPRLPMEDPVRYLAGCVKNSLAPSTWVAYSSVWQQWAELERYVQGPLGAVEREDLTLWFLYLHGTEHRSRTGIGRVLAALSFMFKMQGCGDVTKSFVVRQVAKGLRRGQQRKDTRRPITLSILEGLFGQLDKVCASDYEVALFQFAFSLAFFGAFRIGELVSTKKSEEGGVQFRHVELCGGELQVRIFESKTDKGGKGLLARLHSVAGCRLCPVRCFANYLGVRKSSRTSLLVHADESVMSRFQFIAVLRKCLTGLGLVDKEYSSHSFRIGAATEAARCGLDDATIRRLGRWESRRFQLYVRPHLV